MAKVTYTVKSGDCMWRIAANNASKIAGSTITEKMNTIAKLSGMNSYNDIIRPGQVLVLSEDGSGSSSSSTSASNRVAITVPLCLQPDGGARTVLIAWSWNKTNTKEFKVVWTYSSGTGLYKTETRTVSGTNYDTFNVPEMGKKVSVVITPISDTYKDSKGNEHVYWTAQESTNDAKTQYTFDTDGVIPTPSAPSITIEDYKLSFELNDVPNGVTSVGFEIVQDNKTVFLKGRVEVKLNHTAFSYTITAGSVYKVRIRYFKSAAYGEWSPWSNNGETKPGQAPTFTTCKASTKTSIYLEWTAVDNTEEYEVEYATSESYFDNSNEVKSFTAKFAHYELTGLESGDEYFFRVRAVNDQGESAWSDIVSVIIGTKPTAPMTWSSTTTAIVGEEVTLYWAHSSEDNSSQTSANIELRVNDGEPESIIVDTLNQEDDEKTQYYVLKTSGYKEGASIQFRVRTAGATKEYGEFSVTRTVDIYAPPTLSFDITDKNGNSVYTLTSFPLCVRAIAGPASQTPIGYHLSVVSNSYYETLDEVGKPKIVNVGEEIYSKYFDTSSQLQVNLSAGDIDLHNNASYMITCTVSMNSGLTTYAEQVFTVGWTDEVYAPNADIGIDRDAITAHIRPYCRDGYGELVEGVRLSVYRREIDGSFTEIMTNIDNMKETYIIDPHPSLDYARYRIVAISEATGAVSFYDMPGHPIGEKSIIIQWDEAWSSYETFDGYSPEQPWAGSLLKLHYNIDVSEERKREVSLVKYAGREHPVSYYGTHLGETSNWDTVIPKTDKATLYSLRRLAMWSGDVYVREPSGLGYWANISVSFSQKHLDLTIPVKLSITRVAGGV